MNHYEITIIGAGLSGITAARRLKKQGRNNFIMVDKGGCVGGRLATNSLDGGKVDYGAQFFTVRTEELEEEVGDWLERGWIKQWFGDHYPRYTAMNGMSQLAEHLAANLRGRLNSRISKITQNAGRYQLHTADGEVWESEKVLLTLPAPEVIKLLKVSDIQVSQPAFNQLRKITFEPVYVGIYHFNTSTSLPEYGHVDQNLPQGVERLVDHQKKGISQETLVSVYMRSDWSRRFFGEDYVLSLMKEKVDPYFNWSELKSERLMRWRYAQAKKVLKESYLDLSGDGCLVVAGDAFLRPNDKAGRTRFESAYLSGKDAAAYLSW